MQNLYLRLAPNLLVIVELFLMAAAGLLLVRARRRVSRSSSPDFLNSLERAFGRLARRQRLAALLVGVSVIVVRVALIPLLGISEPRWHDEFSYLLAAYTFAHDAPSTAKTATTSRPLIVPPMVLAGVLRDGTGNGGEHVVCVRANQPDGSDNNNQNHRQHDGILGNVLSFLIVPKRVHKIHRYSPICGLRDHWG